MQRMGFDSTTIKFFLQKLCTSRSPFQIVYGSSPRTTLELRKMEQGERAGAKVEDFAEHVKNLHEDM